ncbi:MAG TPA: methyltransferase domain-containing protein [Streptosporangiaceae bacterium]|nr:methyltransferase domain-containing protein [Streptosporangiaceae bacterium]
MWDPAAYLRFGSERARPFFDLLTRVYAADPGYVVDLGCGPGNLTALLAARWPEAHVLGVDNSAAMIEVAQAEAASTVTRDTGSRGGARPRGGAGTRGGARPRGDAGTQGGAADGGDPSYAAADGSRLAFALADIRTWQPGRPVDVFTCNAVLQWVPGHLSLLTSWAGWLAPGGWLAFQLPGNFDQPSHTILRDLAASARWRPLLHGVRLNRQAMDPAVYLDVLAAAECEVDAWETTYLHVLHGENAVLDWYRGSGLRPVLAALTPADGAEFTAEYGAQLRAAYPAAPYGTVLPFRRIFVVANR